MPDTNDQPWPTTLDAAVDRLREVLTLQQMDEICDTPSLSDSHSRLGAWIQHLFGLRQGNDALMRSIAASRGVSVLWIYPDIASTVILEGLRARLRQQQAAAN